MTNRIDQSNIDPTIIPHNRPMPLDELLAELDKRITEVEAR